MSAHFRWYPSNDDFVVPWNATYEFPSQANKTMKITPRISPKTGSTFLPGNVIRLEFPAQGYVNPAGTQIVFDALLRLPTINTAAGAQGESTTPFMARFQNNIQSIFSRVRIMYGSTPLEDIIDYNVIIRQLTEWSASNVSVVDQTTISEGIGSAIERAVIGGSLKPGVEAYNASNILAPNTSQPVPGNSALYSRQRYAIQLGTGLFVQKKLIPTKFMASQLAIEITLAQPEDCIIAKPMAVLTAGEIWTVPTYFLENVILMPEILEFDASYDDLFLKGLRTGGVPIKMNSWHTFSFAQGRSSYSNLLIQERSRSVKALYTIIRRAVPSTYLDSHATFSNLPIGSSCNKLLTYQYRIGGRYFPASPVQVNLSTTRLSGSEAFQELQKCLQTLGDYRLSNSVNIKRWNMPFYQTNSSNPPVTFGDANSTTQAHFYKSVNEADGVLAFYPAASVGVVQEGISGIIRSLGYAGSGTTLADLLLDNNYDPGWGSSIFCMAQNLETSSGAEISGLNASEQSDIQLMVNWTGPTDQDFIIQTFALYDQMLILYENNAVKLIE